MPLSLNRDSGRIRGRVIRSVIQSFAIFALVFLPLYQADAVHSPAQWKNTERSEVVYEAQAKQKQTLQMTPKNQAAAPLTTDTSIKNTSCRSDRPIASIAKATSASLRKVHAYEALCGSKLFESSSFFISTPTSAAQAVQLASEVRTRLLALQAYGVTPIVFMEPTDPTGRIDMKKYAAGTFNPSITTFFATLRSSGVTDAQMGTWIPIPEANLPVWTDISPAIFSASINHVASIQKQHFPSSKVGLLLDTVSYPRTDDWSGGSVKSWLPYVVGINKGLIDSVGVQGFPWVSKANQGAQTNGSVGSFLQPQLAIDAARILGAREVWINSGSFAQKYTASGEKVIRSAEHRADILNQVLASARRIQASGFKTGIHLFAENKLGVDEATNWSYLPSEGLASDHTEVFKSFAAQALGAKIELSLFDS